LRESVPIPIIGTGSTKSNFKTKPKQKRINGSLRLFKSELVTYISPIPTDYIQTVLRHKVSYDTTFGVNELIKMFLLKWGVKIYI